MKKIISVILALMLVLVIQVPAYSATEPTMTKASIQTYDMTSFNYLLYKPANAKPNMPLIVYLHGGSGKGDDPDTLTVNDGFPKYLKDGMLGDVPAYVLIPQLPADRKGWSDIKASLRTLINTVCTTYSIDTNKVSLTGHSMGGTGTWAIGTAYPDLFSCIAPLSGSIDNTQKNIDALKNMPVWAFVGSSDTIVDPNASIDFINNLETVNSNAKLTIFNGATHFDVPTLTFLDEDIDLINWLISNSR